MAQKRLPFEYVLEDEDPRVTAWGGVPLLAEALDGFGVTDAVREHVKVRGKRKFGSAENVKSLVMMMSIGGDCLDDIEALRQDTALQKLLGMEIPSAETARQWLYEFHDLKLMEEAEKVALMSGGKAFVPEESAPLKGLAEANRALIRAAQHKTPQRVATIDIDATIEESHKREAKVHYLNGRGYQPLMAVWAEQDIVVMDEFRDGNVPAHFEALASIQRAFSMLPDGVEERRLRSDTQSYSRPVLEWLVSEDIQFAIGAQKRAPFFEACAALAPSAWKRVETRPDTLVDVAEVAYLPRDLSSLHGRLRYLAVRMTPRQEELLETGERKVVYLSVVTNRAGEPVDILRWYWAKAGTIEKTHDVIKNELGGGVPPCGRFGANAAWFRISVLTYNLLSVVRRGLSEHLHHARPKRLRLHLLAVPAVVTYHARRLYAHICARLAAANELFAARPFAALV